MQGALGRAIWGQQSEVYGPDCTLEVWVEGTNARVASLHVQQNYVAFSVRGPPLGDTLTRPGEGGGGQPCMGMW